MDLREIGFESGISRVVAQGSNKGVMNLPSLLLYGGLTNLTDALGIFLNI
jgi:hypothetical protein